MTTSSIRTAQISWIVGLFIIAADMISKFFVQLHIPLMYGSPFRYPYGGIGIFQNFFGIEFSITHITNKGAANGIFSDYQVLLLILRIALIFGMFYYVFRVNKERILQIPLAMIIAGAIGNVIDYFIYHHVVDMFHFVLWGYDFPVFNIADIAITVGIVFLFLFSLQVEPEETHA